MAAVSQSAESAIGRGVQQGVQLLHDLTVENLRRFETSEKVEPSISTFMFVAAN